MGFLSGGSKSKSNQQSQSNSSQQQVSASRGRTFNASLPFLMENYGNMAGQGSAALGQIGDLLGVGGDPTAANAAFDKYLDSTGYNFMLDQGSRAITGNRAAKGLLQSGSTGKALTSFGQDIGGQYFNNYLGQLLGMTNPSLSAGSLIAQAGQRSETDSASQGSSTSTSTSSGSSSGRTSNGIGGLLGGAASIIAASDPRLKENIIPTGEFMGDLPVYTFNYKGVAGVTFQGVMADEVAKLYPEALGPTVDGFMTVNYSKLVESIGE